MNTPDTQAPKSRAVTAAIKTAALYLALSDLLSRPEFAGWDQSDMDRIHMQHFVQLFPPRDIAHAAKAQALAIARIVPGVWTKDDGGWRCKAAGAYAGIELFLHYVEPKPVPVVSPANLLDLDAVEKSIASAA